MSEQAFENSPLSVATARHAAVEALHRWGMSDDDPLVGTAALVTSELVTNAVRASSTDVRVRVTTHRNCVEVAVSDDSPVLPAPGRLTKGDLSGRGVAIVAAVASDWGYEVDDGRSKTVWCRLEVPPDSALDMDCPR